MNMSYNPWQDPKRGLWVFAFVALLGLAIIGGIALAIKDDGFTRFLGATVLVLAIPLMAVAGRRVVRQPGPSKTMDRAESER